MDLTEILEALDAHLKQLGEESDTDGIDDVIEALQSRLDALEDMADDLSEDEDE